MLLNDFSKIKLPERVASAINEVDRKVSTIDRASFRNSELYLPSMHLLNRKGKLMRPSLVLLGAYVTGQDARFFADLALSAELLHTSSLIHDDIIDRDAKRRGVDAVHVKYGNEAAILAGDALISKAISVASRYGRDTIERISQAAMDMCAGEALDYAFQRSGKIPSLKEYEEIARMKSASLIATCCSIAAFYNKEKVAKNLYEFGMKMGVAFQMRDDILDFADSKSGKGKGTDRKRPNVVMTLKATSDLSDKLALEKAVKLQNSYVENAIRELGAAGRGSLLSKYASATKV